MKQKRKVFVNDTHEYTISKQDLEFSGRMYKLKTSKTLPWAEEHRDKAILSALDTGNNVTIQFLGNALPMSITLGYDDMQELYIFLQTYMMDELRPDKIEIKKSKKDGQGQ